VSKSEVFSTNHLESAGCIIAAHIHDIRSPATFIALEMSPLLSPKAIETAIIARIARSKMFIPVLWGKAR